MLRFALSIVAIFCACLPLASQESDRAERSLPPKERELPCKLESKHLPNAVQIHSRVISGGLPEGEKAFRELSERGVKTIVSVDGAVPDVEMARRFGLRYVHLPHGYDGIPDRRARDLAKAVSELDGPIYIHCHHGKHRSPAAASVACVASGLIDPSNAVPILEMAGTSPRYRGLYKAAREIKPLESGVLRNWQVEFVQVAEVPALAAAMVEIDTTHHHLKLLAESDWRPPAGHPDLNAVHEALLMKEHYVELLRRETEEGYPVAFIEMLQRSRDAAREMEEKLGRWQARIDDPGRPDPAISRAFQSLSSDCRKCHERFRD